MQEITEYSILAADYMGVTPEDLSDSSFCLTGFQTEDEAIAYMNAWIADAVAKHNASLKPQEIADTWYGQPGIRDEVKWPAEGFIFETDNNERLNCLRLYVAPSITHTPGMEFPSLENI